MAGELSCSTAQTAYGTQLKGQTVVYKQFSGTSTANSSTSVQAAGGTGTKHIVTHVMCDVDAAGETLSIMEDTNIVLTLRFPTVDTYIIRFPGGLEIAENQALIIDQGALAAIHGRIYYVAGATAGKPIHTL